MRKINMLFVVFLICSLSGCAFLDSLKSDEGALEECFLDQCSYPQDENSPATNQVPLVS